MTCRRLERLPGRDLGAGLRLAVALSPRARLLGLALLEDIPAGVGLFLPGTSSIHTFGMRFPLDAVFLDAEGRPLRVDAHIKPGRVAWCRGARAVLETRPGEARRFLSRRAPLWLDPEISRA